MRSASFFFALVLLVALVAPALCLELSFSLSAQCDKAIFSFNDTASAFDDPMIKNVAFTTSPAADLEIQNSIAVGQAYNLNLADTYIQLAFNDFSSIVRLPVTADSCIAIPSGVSIVAGSLRAPARPVAYFITQ